MMFTDQSCIQWMCVCCCCGGSGGDFKGRRRATHQVERSLEDINYDELCPIDSGVICLRFWAISLLPLFLHMGDHHLWGGDPRTVVPALSLSLSFIAPGSCYFLRVHFAATSIDLYVFFKMFTGS